MATDQGAVALVPDSQAVTTADPAVTAPVHQPGGQQDADHHHTPATSDDPDEAALASARSEAQQEEGIAPAAPEPRQRQQAPGRQPQQQRQQQRPQAPAQGQQQAPMVPKTRLDEVLRRAKALEDENLYLKGVVHARSQMASPGQQPAAAPTQSGQQPPAPQQPTQQQPAGFDQQIAAHQAAIKAAAVQFDQGEITMSDFVEIQARETNAIAVIRERALIATVPQTQRPGLADQQILSQHQAQMEAAFPWTRVMTVPELQFIAGVVRQEQAALGTPIVPGVPAETIRLRTEVAKLTEVYGPRWYPDRIAQVDAMRQQPTSQPQFQPTQQPAPTRQPSSNAIAGARKLDLAARQPPNINHAGVPGNSGDLITDAHIEAMTAEELEALPPQVRARILSG